MTDDQMDARLSAAGERWRDANTAPAAVSLAELEPRSDDVVDVSPDSPSDSRKRRRTVWAAGASAIAAVAIAVLVLSLVHNGGSPKPAAEGGTADLIGRWTLVSMTKADATPQQVVSPADLSVSSNQISGTDACNHIGGDVTIADHTIDLSGGLATTDMACIDRQSGFDDEVALIHAVLTGTVNWSIAGHDLTLANEDAGALIYRRVIDTTTTDSAKLIGTTWSLTTIAGDGPNGAASSARGLQLSFTTGKYVISLECSTVDGNLDMRDGVLVFGPGKTNGHRCPYDPNKTDQVNQHALDMTAGEVTWSVTNDRLTIVKNGVGSLTFERSGS